MVYFWTELLVYFSIEINSVRKPVNIKVLGYGFVPTYRKGEKGKYQLVANEKSWKSLKEKLKTITRKTTPMSFDERIQKLREVTQGWLNYFRMASIQGKLKELDGWLRNRLRYCIWHHWKGETLRKCPVDIFSHESTPSG